MKVRFKKSFTKDIKKLNDLKLKNAIHDVILNIEKAKTLSEIKKLTKLSGYDSYFRIRIGDYRIGLRVENDVVFFVVFSHRKDIYKSFP